MRILMPRGARGFATVELLVTIVTIGLIFGAFITTFTTIQNINKKSRDIQKANTIAFEKTQTYENTDFNDLPDTIPPGTLQEVEDFSDEIPRTVQPPREGKVFINTVSPTLKHVVVRVQFGGDSGQIIQYVNFIQQNGVGR